MTLWFSSAIFLSACLLFWLELIFAKLVLPMLGGAPAVWNTCTVFYQLSLLAGYVYAHAVTASLGTKRQSVLHLALVALSLLFLPISLSDHWLAAAVDHPIWTVLRLAAVSVGPPFFIISAASPLLQKWFAATKDPKAKDPYFLYQASNLGSLFALLSYPTIIEPHLKLREQRIAWSAGYAMMAAATAACAILAWKQQGGRQPSIQAERYVTPLRARLRWAGLAFVPSSLMLGVTTYLSNFIAPLPLLWVIPLAIYLMSFVLTFGRKPWIRHDWMLRIQPMLLLPLALLIMTNTYRPAWVLILFHLSTLAVTAMVCHGELALRRPPAWQLTEFYLWIAIGGALGGVLNALIGPLLFKTVAEYPLTLVAACLLRPRDIGSEPFNKLDLILPLALGLATAAVPSFLQYKGMEAGAVSLWLLCVPILLCFLFKDRPLRLGLGLAMLFLSSLPYSARIGRLLELERSFFGVRQVVIDPENKVRWLSSGNVVHGGQLLDSAASREPLAYYTRSGPLGQMFDKLRVIKDKTPIAVIGLGTGCMACYGRTGQSWIFYEIDPVVGRIARDARFFTFLRDCPPRSEIVLGDARLSLRAAPENFYGWIVVDAFNSDAIPVHLLTREAMQLYLSKLAPHGFLAFHISNHFLDLEPVLASLTKDSGISALIENDDNSDPGQAEFGKFASDWVIAAREPEDLAPLRQDPRWRELKGSGEAPWSDDYSNLLGIIRWN